MVVQQQPQMQFTITYDTNTKNQSFLDMHYFLKSIGIQNNAFFLAIYDTDLIGVDPRDPKLNVMMKKKIFLECQRNFWYFIREVVRIPDQGGTVGGGVPYKLHRGNLALNYCFVNNFNLFLELPRQHGKTVSACVWYLWVFNFGTTNSQIAFMNKKHEDSKDNLIRLKNIRAALPSYLIMDSAYGFDGKKLKATNRAEKIAHPSNGNLIVAKSSARNKAGADGLGRGCTMPMQWYDEYAFILFNDIIYAAATPAFVTASGNAKNNGAPYGILITTTPGDMTTDEGKDAYATKEAATPFQEVFYDYSYQQMQEIQNLNDSSTFFYARFTYKQLGSGIDYFKRMVKELKKNWPKIRREVLLEWSVSSDNSPFTKQDLEAVKTKIKPPLYTITLNRIFTMNIYKRAQIKRFPPIIGVDVSGGYNKDSSAITVIDSETTDVIATLNCNYISIPDLAKCIYELVVKYMPNAIVNIERNGGFGASVIGLLKNSKIKRNLYYEIKDRVVEDRIDPNGSGFNKRKIKTKVYGFDETKASRNLLMEILRDRMDNHKNKFAAEILYNELCTLEVKKNGRIEHTDNGHDDQIFSYLMALYVWYYGKDLMENFGMDKRMIRTDTEEDVEIDYIENDSFDDISKYIETEIDGDIKASLEYIESDKSILYEDFLEKQRQQDSAAIQAFISHPIGRKAYAEKYHVDEEDLMTAGTYKIPDSMFNDMYPNDEQQDKERAAMQKYFNNIVIR